MYGPHRVGIGPASGRKWPRCLGCHKTLRGAPVVDTAVTYEVCTCGSPKWVHVLPTEWHRACLAQARYALATQS